MATRRSLRGQWPEEDPQGRRRSLRLARQKAEPFNYQRSLAYQAPTNSAQMDIATPRTIFKKVLQTQPIVSPLVSEKPDSPKTVDTTFHFPVKFDSSINLEVSLSDSIQREKPRISRHPTRSKKVRLSEFERGLNNHLQSNTAQDMLDHTSLTKSLQISFTTPAPLNSAGRKGLIRRPKNYRGVNVKDFEGGLEQDLLQIKDSAGNNPEDQKTTTFQSNNTEALSVETELFLPPHSDQENEMESSNVLPEPDLASKPLGRRSAPSLSQTQDKISDMEVEKVAESIPPQILEPESEPETESMEKDEGYPEESPQDAGKGLRPSLGKEKLSPGPEDAGSIKNVSQKGRFTPQKQQQKHFEGNSPDEELLTPTETGPDARRPSTQTDAHHLRASQRNFSTWLSRKIVRRSVNEMVAQITKELENIIPAVAGQGMAKVDSEEDSSLREITVDISQSPRVATSSGSARGKTPKKLEKTPFKGMRDRTNPQTGDRNRSKEMKNVETEHILDFEAKDNPEVEMSESEDIAVEISQSPRVATPGRRASGKTPKTLERTSFKAMRDRTNPQTGDRNRTKEMRNVATEQILQFEAKGNPEVEEMLEFEDVANENSQSPRVATPSRRASGKTPKTLERTPFKAMRDRTNPQTGDRNRTKEMRNVATEQILQFEAKGNPEVEEMSEFEDVAIEITQSPRVATPNRCASRKTPKTLEGTSFKAMRDRTNPQTGDRNRSKEMKNAETEQILEFEDKDKPEVEGMSESEDFANEISQSPRVATPSRRASGKTPKTLDRTSFKAMRDRTHPRTGDRKKMRKEQILQFEAEDNLEVEGLESENVANEISQSPRVATPSRRASGKTPKTLDRTSFKAMRDRTHPRTGDRKKMRKEQILQFEAEDNLEVEGLESENVANEISQSPRVATPSRRASGKTPKTLDRTSFKAMRDRTHPRTGDRKKMRNEQILQFEAEDNLEVEGLESENVAIEISQSPRVATPSRRASRKTPKTLERTPFKAMRDKTHPQTSDRKERRNVETEQILQFEAEDNLEIEMSESEDVANENAQSPRVATPHRRTSGKTPKTLDSFKAMRDRTNPQTGDRNRTKEMRNVEQILEFQTEDSPEVEDMSESEDVEPTARTPAFVRAKAFHCTPLLSSPHISKEVASRTPVKQNLVQRVPKPGKKARQEKREPSLPSNLVKKMFTHYVKMPVTKEALQVVDKCVNIYFKHLSNDLEAYVNHARRKTAEAADLELLMRRQGLITDKMPLNVLVERHLPLEYRKLLIPIAISGNKVIPQNLK
ncbi:centromere protein T [Thamnophis elegans]|uniref:centromere protein T n=1 Tax=Thamnophis elegans TaxID=35005 RepID=UPI001378F5AE|nr:centromere protein T [Thamnophis elegans]